MPCTWLCVCREELGTFACSCRHHVGAHDTPSLVQSTRAFLVLVSPLQMQKEAHVHLQVSDTLHQAVRFSQVLVITVSLQSWPVRPKRARILHCSCLRAQSRAQEEGHSLVRAGRTEAREGPREAPNIAECLPMEEAQSKVCPCWWSEPTALLCIHCQRACWNFPTWFWT